MNDDIPLLICLTLLVGILLLSQPVVPETSKPRISVKLEAISNHQIVLMGGNSARGLTSPPGYSEKSLGMMVVTAYSSTVDQCDSTPFITADGSRVSEGGIACPRYIPFDTLVKIDDKIYTCNDRMNTRYAHRFDIWFADREQATQFGKQVKEIIRLD